MTEQTQVSLGGPGRTGHPELEELAALADGRCHAADATRVRAHLASCEECYEVFLETLQLQEEHEEEDEEWEAALLARAATADPDLTTPLPFLPKASEEGGETSGTRPSISSEGPQSQVAWEGDRRSRRGSTRRSAAFPFNENLKPHLRWAAAVLVATLLGFGFYHRLPDRSVASMAKRAGKVAATQVANIAWGERTRGAGSHEGDPSFRLGVELLNLQVALESKDGNTADAAAAAVNGLLDPIAFMDEKSKEFYRKLRVRIPKQTPESLGGEVAKEADVLHDSESVDKLDFELGTWAEAGRFAAYSGKADFFDPKSAQYFLKNLPKDEDPSITAALKTIDAQSAAQGRGLDYAALKSAFDQILKFHYPEGERSSP